jgi:hypothetical protein
MRASRERGVTARVSCGRGERAGATVSPPTHEPADPTLESPSPPHALSTCRHHFSTSWALRGDGGERHERVSPTREARCRPSRPSPSLRSSGGAQRRLCLSLCLRPGGAKRTESTEKAQIRVSRLHDVTVSQLTRVPGAMSFSSRSTLRPCSVSLAARIIPCDSSPIILRGARFATTITRFPISASGA